ncbi:MAG: DNA cytosine methyltransferase [Candidatus Acidiferrales bacterium]
MTGLALELFPCSGGMALGFRRAGIAFDFAFDADPDACDSYEQNLGHRPVQMDVRDLLRMARGGWSPGPVRLLVADPPCTPWSRAGKRLGVEDERDMLGVTTELIRLLRPSAYLIGNVPGLEDSTQWPHLQAALAPLRKAGYCIADFTTFDAADFGVPQHRIRPWWYGHLDGPCIAWPMPTHGDVDARQATVPGCKLKPWVTCREALGHLPPEQLGRPVRLRYRERKRAGEKPRASRASKPAETGLATAGSALVVHEGRLTTVAAAAPSRTVTRNTHGVLLEWPWERPATTVLCEERIGPPGRHDTWSIMSMPGAVLLSERAATILQGFSESWRFCGATKRTRWSQIGQATPPALAEAVARSVRAQLEATEARCDTGS